MDFEAEAKPTLTVPSGTDNFDNDTCDALNTDGIHNNTDDTRGNSDDAQENTDCTPSNAEGTPSGTRKRTKVLLLVAILALALLVPIVLHFWNTRDFSPQSTTSKATSHHTVPIKQQTHTAAVHLSGAVSVSMRTVVMVGSVVFAVLVVVLAFLLTLYNNQVFLVAEEPQIAVTPDPIPDTPVTQVDAVMWLVGGSAIANLLISILTLLALFRVDKVRQKAMTIMAVLITCILLQQGIALLAIVFCVSMYNALVRFDGLVSRSDPSVAEERFLKFTSLLMVLFLGLAIVASVIAFPVLLVLSFLTSLCPSLLFRRLFTLKRDAIAYPKMHLRYFEWNDVSLPTLS